MYIFDLCEFFFFYEVSAVWLNLAISQEKYLVNQASATSNMWAIEVISVACQIVLKTFYSSNKIMCKPIVGMNSNFIVLSHLKI